MIKDMKIANILILLKQCYNIELSLFFLQLVIVNNIWFIQFFHSMKFILPK